jgi:nucleotide-binding universal stress UspA family protein
MDKPSNLLVPIDFSPVTEKALEHACILAQKSSEEIHLLHVIKNTEEYLANELLHKLELLAKKYRVQFGIKIIPYIENGNIFNTISEFSLAQKSKLIVMGTHGVKGIQHLTGAFAVKVILSSKIPVIITQLESQPPKQFEKVLIPIHESEEIKLKLLKVVEFAKMTGARIVLFEKAAKQELEQIKIKLNANFLKKHLEQHQIKVELIHMKESASDFSKAYIKAAKELNANLIVILTTPEKGIKEYVLGPIEQQVINNTARIPVMCINTLQTIYS